MKLYDKDLLKRENFLNQLQNITLALKRDTDPHSFAINGKWGCGKSWILEKYEYILSNNLEEQFIVFHFNAWQNDFYDEPLTAMITSIATQLNKKISVKNIFNGLFKKVGNKLLEIANELIKEKTKIDVIGLKNLIKESKSHTEIDVSYDTNSVISITINQIIKQLNLLTENHTIIFIVDELDRCLPEYAIKVLERLHHLFGRLDKSITVLSIDSTQLNETIKNIFGEKTSTDAYMTKFVDFTISLDNGTLESANLLERIDSYRGLFKDGDEAQFKVFFDELIKNIFIGIPIREQIKLVQRAETIHKSFIMPGNETFDNSVMCCQLFMLTTHYWNIEIHNGIHNTFNHLTTKLKDNNLLPGTKYTKFLEFTHKYELSFKDHVVHNNFNYFERTGYYLDNMVSKKTWFVDHESIADMERNLTSLQHFNYFLKIIN